MADKGTPDDGPSLEMPSFSLRRKKSPPDEGASAPAAEAPAAEAPVEPTPGPAPHPEPAREPLATHEQTHIIATDGPERPQRRTTTAAAPVLEPEAEADVAPVARASRFTLPTLPALPAVPALPARTAVAITGTVVGGLAVLLTWLSISACDVVRGTASCGGGPGFLILVAVLIMLAYAGALLLSAFGVPDAGSTSVLAVGITAVLVMLFLLDSIYDWWMVIAIPVVAVIAFVGSWWITNAVVETE